MFEIRHAQRPATCRPAIMGEVRPGQTIWTGHGWSTIIHRIASQDEMVTLERVTSTGLRFTTDYPARRRTSVRIAA
jgi:hypothetical protein